MCHSKNDVCMCFSVGMLQTSAPASFWHEKQESGGEGSENAALGTDWESSSAPAPAPNFQSKWFLHWVYLKILWHSNKICLQSFIPSIVQNCSSWFHFYYMYYIIMRCKVFWVLESSRLCPTLHCQPLPSGLQFLKCLASHHRKKLFENCFREQVICASGRGKTPFSSLF